MLSGSQVASITALLSTQYGVVLIAKVAATAAVAAVALRHALYTWRGLASARARRPPPRTLTATVGVEAAGALAVVLLAAVLGSSAPARGPQFDPVSSEAPASLATRQSGELVSAVSVKPNRLGPNLLSVQVVDSRRPPLAPISGVTVILRHPGGTRGSDTLATTRTGSRFDAGTVDLRPGDLDVAVAVHRTGLTDAVIEVPWTVNGAEVKRAPVVVSAAPLAPSVNQAAMLVALVAVAVLLAALLRRRLTEDREHSGNRRASLVRRRDGRFLHAVRGWRGGDGETLLRSGHPPRRGQDQRTHPAGDAGQRRP
jgi:copper transport protein